MIRQKDKVKYGTATIPYSIIKTGRVKTSELIVDANTITVRAPLHKDKAEIQKIVLAKASWILKKQKEYREMITEVVKPSFKDNTTLPYLGRNCLVKVKENQSKNSIEIIDGKLLVHLKSAKPSSSHLERLYENFLIEKAQVVFEVKVEEHSKRLGVIVKGVDIKKLRNRWGSLTKNDVLNLNLNLVKAPEDVIDYIILHELCHLKIKEHSHHYWDLVHKFMPNCHDKIKWLNVNGSNLL
jgi:predicted metal-dependent hydrolase